MEDGATGLEDDESLLLGVGGPEESGRSSNVEAWPGYAIGAGGRGSCSPSKGERGGGLSAMVRKVGLRRVGTKAT